MRIDKFLANATGFSRSDIKKSLKNGLVTVNDQSIKNPAQHIHPEHDEIEFDGQLIREKQARYYMLNKPKGVVSATKDGEHATVIDLLIDSGIFDTDDLRIAGRLDIDTTGLVLITDDGQWLHQVSSGKKNVGKSYLVTLADSIPESEQALIADSFKQGIMLKGETKATRPAEITFLDDKHAEICIHEGRYHQVKRMFAYHGNAVCDLHRYQIESLIMDPALEEGYARALNEREIALFSHLNQAP